MHLAYPILTVLAFEIIAITATRDLLIPTPGVQPRSPVKISLRDLAIEERQNGGPAQKVLVACPEMFNEPPVACAACGGESPDRPGKCKIPNASSWYCACSNTGKNGLITSVVTATANGATATGTYELDTMTEYASLRQHITITTTASLTATGTATGDLGLETIAAVVLAGGVAWFLASSSGEAAALAALKPPDKAQDHDDDKQCPNPEHKCGDCDGKNQMCTTGKDQGCACEEKTCPADGSNDQPKCTDNGCNEKDGKCTGGDHQGCDCKKQNCPDLTKVTLWCTDCGGKDDKGLCKGDPEEDPPNLWQGCECKDFPDFSTESKGLVRLNIAQHQAILQKLPDISAMPPPPSQSSSAPAPFPSCDVNSISDIPNNVFTAGSGLYSKFCDKINGGDKSKSLTQIVDSSGNVIPPKKQSSSKEKRTPPADPGAYNAYTFDLEWTGGQGCNSDCGSSYAAMAGAFCGHTGGEQNKMTNEAKLDTGCGTYSYKINAPPGSSTNKPPPPPPPPNPNPGLECESGGPWKQFNRDASVTQINKVCKDLHNGKVVLSQSGQSLMPAGKPYDDDNQISGKDVAEGGATLIASLTWALLGCEDQSKPKDVDFGVMGVDDCVKSFMIPLDGCGEFDNKSNKKFWKWGGINKAQCAFWTVWAQ